MEEQKKQGGKKPGQKFKSLLIWDTLQKRTDENHAISLKDDKTLQKVDDSEG